MASNWQVQVVLQHTTNIPRDVSVNTFAFHWPNETPPDWEGGHGAILTAPVRRFYNNPEGGNSISDVLSGRISRVTNACKFNVYEAMTSNAEPVWSTNWTLGPPVAGQNALPYEVAVAASFQGAPTVSMPQRRRRGRVFLGPLNGAALQMTSDSCEVMGQFRTTIANACETLLDETNNETNPFIWCVWSRVAGLLVPITNGWVNNEPDTQRRRQDRPTSRTTWGDL